MEQYSLTTIVSALNDTSNYYISHLLYVTLVVVCLLFFVITFKHLLRFISLNFDVSFATKKKKRWKCKYCGSVNEDEAVECPHCKATREMEELEPKPSVETVAAPVEPKVTDGKIDTVVIKEKTVRQPGGKVYQKKQKIYKDLH